jgi:predicted MFS family arabinose efflux permease
MITVTGPFLSAENSDPERRSRALGLYGLATTVGAIVATPLGVALVDDSPGVVVLCAAGCAILALAMTVFLIPADARRRDAVGGVSLAILRRARHMLVPFFLIAAAMGVTLSYLALLAPAYAAGALLVSGLGKSVGRSVVSPWCSPARIRTTLLLTLCLTLVGYGMLAASGNSLAVLPSAFVAGVGSGCVATLALIGTFALSAREEFATSSAAWNLAFNGGMAGGAFAFSFFLTFTSYRGGFALTAGIVALALVLAAAMTPSRVSRSVASSPSG